MKNTNPFLDLKWLALAIVGTVLVLLTLGAFVRALKSGEGLEPGIASAAFALLGAMVAGSLGATAVKKDLEKNKEPEDIDPSDDY